MRYEIFDSTGNLVEAFQEETQALEILDRIVESEPNAAKHVAVFMRGEDGMTVGDPIFAQAGTDAR